MTGTIFAIVGLFIGACIAIAGGAYLKKEWADKESRKIYGVFVAIGLIIIAGTAIKIITALL
ncbi:MAG: hypothetical protein LBJ07_03245 [Actinomycetes bacterium]|jgi:hypothetical protein|nr:hypothetical protein [Actinomycetes bacterium]